MRGAFDPLYTKSKNTDCNSVEFICFAQSAANSINFSSYLLYAINGLSTHRSSSCGRSPNGELLAAAPLAQEWINKGISIATITTVCLVHAFLPRMGIWVSNGLGVFKIIMLLVVVFTGFAALSGRMAAPRPDNFSSFDGAGDACPLAPADDASRAANFSIALMQVLYSYSGWESANYVSSISPFVFFCSGACCNN